MNVPIIYFIFKQTCSVVSHSSNASYTEHLIGMSALGLGDHMCLHCSAHLFVQM